MNATIAELPAIGGRTEIRGNSSNSEQIVKIALDKIRILSGFNVRHDYGDIKGLAESILNNGQSLPGHVDVLEDGNFVLTDGHRRFKALQLLESNGNECYFMAIVNKAHTTDEQRIIQMFTTQDNKQLEPIEAADIIQRLANLGHKQKDIAKKIGKHASYVSQMLALAAESPQIKKHVEDGNIKVSAVLKAQKTTPNTNERVEKVNKAVADAKTNSINGLPKKNQTAKTVSKELAAPEQIKKVKKIVKAILMDARIKYIECDGNLVADELLTEIISKYL